MDTKQIKAPKEPQSPPAPESQTEDKRPIATESNKLGTKATQGGEDTEQARTRIAKQLFLELMPQYRGIVRMVCAKIGMNFSTYYRWKIDDPEFAEAVEKQYVHLKEQIRDVLLKKILVEEDGPSVRYYLDRKDAEFMPKAKTMIITGTRTLDDILEEDENKLNEENGDTIITTEEADPQGPAIPAREIIQLERQEGPASEIQIQPGPGILLEEKNTPKPDSKSEAKGSEQTHRRGPVARVHSERF